MGERKGTNKYYPPDYDPRKGGLNKWQGTHALRERARKLHLGILIIRFEMPFNVWCEGCNNHVGMGVRYNAEKKKVGNYYNTPIYEFRMKCHLCDNHFQIRTDPKNFDYELISGLRRQERRWNMAENDQVVPVDRETSNKLNFDAMYKLEHSELDQAKLKSAAPDLERLENYKEKWKDDFAVNQRLRKSFRFKKKELKAEKERDETLLKKYALSIPLQPESSSDRKLASMIVDYATVQSDDNQVQSGSHHEQPLTGVFSKSNAATPIPRRLNKKQQMTYLKGRLDVANDAQKATKLDQELKGCSKLISSLVKSKTDSCGQDDHCKPTGLDVLKCYGDGSSSGD